MSLTYKESGVNIDAGEKAVVGIQELIRRTHSPYVLGDVGAFGGCFAFPVSDYDNPVLVSSTDGVGTKLKIAILTNCHKTVGQCLVNHCVNDILTAGAKPLYFLDYIGVGNLKPEVISDVVFGISRACCENGCSLIGGETAEMPDIYHENEYDLVGTIVGVVEREHLLSSRVQKDDVLIGLPSTGLHTNGFTLARKVLLSHYTVDDYVGELGTTLGEELLKIHRSYLNPVSHFLQIKELHALSHITGGGIAGNTLRVIPDEFKLKIDWSSWEWQPIFKLIQKLGKIETEEMKRVFNLGIGFVLVVDRNFADLFYRKLKDIEGEPVFIGEIT